jgi:hypothetical protein
LDNAIPLLVYPRLWLRTRGRYRFCLNLCP